MHNSVLAKWSNAADLRSAPSGSRVRTPQALMYVPITQWLECWSYEPEVEGSTPSRNINAPLAQLVERTTVNRDVSGSIPLRSVI
jgi:hypothetical protein